MDEQIEIYVRLTGFTPSCYQQDLVLSRVTDLEKWEKAVEFWAGNGYRAQSVLKVIEYYEGMTNGTSKQLNGFGRKRTDADVISESRDFYSNFPN